MSDDDTAKDKANKEAAQTEKVEAAQDSTAADATGKVGSDSPGDETVKLETGKVEEAAASTAGAAPKVAADDPTVKMATEQAAAAAPAGKPAGDTSGRSWALIGAAVAAGVVLVAAVVLAVVYGLMAGNRDDQLSARDDSTAAACDFGKAVATYDSDHLDDYFKKVNDLSTGEWGKFFGGATGTLKDAMVSVKAKSKLDEIHCAWESGSDSQANVVLVITQEQSNQAAPQADKLTIPGVASMEKHDGKWLVAKFDSPVTKGGMGPGGGAAAPGGAPGAPAPGAPAPGAPAPQPGG
ncbi:MAG: hypothetical protein J2P18_19785 [Nocardia sp.]|nr:hypothetical protein [Nocardia sp.]